MFNLVIILKEPSTNLLLGFKEKGLADAARLNIRKKMDEFNIDKINSRITVKDDFSHECDIFASNIATVIVEDNQKNSEMTNEKNIDIAHANDAFIKRREKDMELIRLFPSNNMAGIAGRG